MKTKRILFLLICVVMTLAVLVACNNQNTPKPTSSSQTSVTAGPPVKLVFEKPIWGSKTTDDPTWKPIHDKILEKFNIDLQVVGQQNPSD